MTTKGYRQLITEGIADLPMEALAETADFVYFVRRRFSEPALYAQDLEAVLLYGELERLSRAEEHHVEEEFEGYEQQYPKE